MFKIGDEVFIKAEITAVHCECERPYYVQPQYDSYSWVSEDKVFPVDKTYERGLKDAWKLARKLEAFEPDEREQILGYRTLEAIIADLTLEYVADKIEAYEREKEIKVGDVVMIDDDVNALVIDEISEESVFILTENGCIEKRTKKHLEKTDKHLNIGDLLRQIGE